MDRYITVIKSSTGRAPKSNDEQRSKYKYSPYNVGKPNDHKLESWKDKKRTASIIAPLLKDETKPSAAAITKHLLNTLSEPSNPITHSDIYQRTVHISSAATGHQRSETHVNQKLYHESRSKKIKEQLPQKQRGHEGCVLSGVRVYIGGYLADTTDIEMKRIVNLGGGQVLHSSSGATHILTSQQLSASKTHRLLSAKTNIKVHVVKPEWIFDSIDAGKRMSERDYSVLKNTSMQSVADMFAAGTSKKLS